MSSPRTRSSPSPRDPRVSLSKVRVRRDSRRLQRQDSLGWGPRRSGATRAGAWWALQLSCSPVPPAQRGHRQVTPMVQTLSIQSADSIHTFIIENLIFFISKSSKLY